MRSKITSSGLRPPSPTRRRESAVATGGQSIDMRRLLIDALGMRVTATDGGADGIVRRLDDGQKQFNVVWDTALASWKTDPALGSDNPNLVYDRSGQMNSSNSETPVYWLAWEKDEDNKPIMDVTKMKRVGWKTLEYMNDQGVMDTKAIWVDINDDKRRWNPTKRKFVDRLTNV